MDVTVSYVRTLIKRDTYTYVMVGIWLWNPKNEGPSSNLHLKRRKINFTEKNYTNYIFNILSDIHSRIYLVGQF